MDNPKPRLSRRGMLVALGGAVVAAGAFAASPFRAVLSRQIRELVVDRRSPRRSLALASASYEEWMGQVGSVFAVGGGASMRLAGVRAFPSEGARPLGLARESAFVAFFDPIGRQTMAGDLIYTASHARYGALPIFLSASVDPRMPARMVAVFN